MTVPDDPLGPLLAAGPGRLLVALDVDGTLAPIVSDPDRARPLPEAIDAVHRLAPLVHRVALVTGRPAELVARWMQLGASSPVLVLGAYGADRWERGVLHAAAVPMGIAAVRRDLERLLETAPEGVRLEDKRVALAVHTRSAPLPATALEDLRPALEELADTHGLRVEPGRHVLELRAPVGDKGDALRSLLADDAVAAVLVAGDDLGDLPAFAEVVAARERGLAGLVVASASEEAEPVRAAADLVVDGPEGVAALLAELVERAELAGDPGRGRHGS